MSIPGVDDADDLRGYHFKRLLRKRLTLILTGVLTVAAGIGAGVAVGPALGLFAAAAAVLIALHVVFRIADSKAADDFFEVYAQQRGMTHYSDRGRLPALTPLLQKGDERYTEHYLRGPIGDSIDGILALYTYEEETYNSKGQKHTTYYKYTVGVIEVPESSRRAPEIYCQRRVGFRALEKFEDVFRSSKERVKLESEAFDSKFEIFAGEKQDQNFLRQIFTPTFIVWLADSAPQMFAFELVRGTLCCYVSGHKEKEAELDQIRAATAAVVTRLREESLE